MDTQLPIFRVLGLLAILTVIGLYAIPPVVALFRRDHHVQSTDVAGKPPGPVDPRPTTGALPPPRPLTQTEALETLKQHGYVEMTDPQSDGNGGWTSRAAKRFDGPKREVTVDRAGDVAER